MGGGAGVVFLAVEGLAEGELCAVVSSGQVGEQGEPDAVAVGFNAKFGEELDAGFGGFGVRAVRVIFEVGAVFSEGRRGSGAFFKYAGEAKLGFGGGGCAGDEGAIVFGCEIVPMQVFAELRDVQARGGFFGRGLDARLVCLVRGEGFLVRAEGAPDIADIAVGSDADIGVGIFLLELFEGV